MRLQIRPFQMDDVPGVVAVQNGWNPNDPLTVDTLRHALKVYNVNENGREYRLGMWVAERAGQIVGMGRYRHSTDLFDPQRFWVDIWVHPGAQGQEVERALYDQVMAGLAPLSPRVLWSSLLESWEDRMRFLEARGFNEFWRQWESHLDVASFDLTSYAVLEAQLQAEGIEIKSFAALAGDPDRDRKFYDLDVEVTRDIPSVFPIEMPSFERYVERTLNGPRFLPDGVFVACHQGDYVGLSFLNKSTLDSCLDVELTGVRQAYRRRGIALALKARGMAYANAGGYSYVRTWNDTSNSAMLAVNASLGYRPQPAILWMEKHLEG